MGGGGEPHVAGQCNKRLVVVRLDGWNLPGVTVQGPVIGGTIGWLETNALNLLHGLRTAILRTVTNPYTAGLDRPGG